MRLLFLGDVVGKSGRRAVADHLPGLRETLAIDFTVCCGENAAHGFGMTEKTCNALYAAGVDVITTGNHAFDRREIIPVMERDRRILRPLNLPEGTPGRGAATYDLPDGRVVLVVQVMGRLFMPPIDDPFAAVEKLVAAYPLKVKADAVIVDVHAEASSEKIAIAHMIDGKASMVVGSHTHVPTADAQILTGGTAAQTDAGMCGDYDSVIGMKVAGSLGRFKGDVNAERLAPADGEATLCGLFVETDDATGLATRVEAVRLGGRLAPCVPEA